MSQGTLQERFSQLDRFEKASQIGRYTGQSTGVIILIAAFLRGARSGSASIALPSVSKEIVKKISCETSVIGARVAKEGVVCLDKLSKAGQFMDRSGLTKAGRALDKHGNRLNSPFPKAIGNPANKNMQGQFHLDDILTHPNTKMIRGDKGDIRLHTPDGRGAHFLSDSSFKGFLDYE